MKSRAIFALCSIGDRQQISFLNDTEELLTLTVLEKVAAYFNKPFSYFFDENNEMGNEAESYKDKYYLLLEKYNACLEANAGIESKVLKAGKSIVDAVDKPELKK